MRSDTTKPSGLRLRRMLGTVTLWQERRRSRAELVRLSAYQLRDIGLVPGDAYVEAAKPFWRA
jgi:uncharacterized protein YjiS (DUF1127 family)